MSVESDDGKNDTTTIIIVYIPLTRDLVSLAPQ